MYEAVHASPDGDSTVARFAMTAASVGYEGVVVRSRAHAQPDYDRAELVEAYGVDVVSGVELDAQDREQASGDIRDLREDATLLVARGRSPDLNRFIAESERVDVLAGPMRGGGDVNHVIVKAAKESGVRIEFDVSQVLRESGGKRVEALRGLRKLREIVEYFDAPYVVSTDPQMHLHLRSPRELMAVGEEIGFDREQIETGLAEWASLAARNRERLSETFIAPGVERGRYEEDD